MLSHFEIAHKQEIWMKVNVALTAPILAGVGVSRHRHQAVSCAASTVTERGVFLPDSIRGNMCHYQTDHFTYSHRRAHSALAEGLNRCVSTWMLSPHMPVPIITNMPCPT